MKISVKNSWRWNGLWILFFALHGSIVAENLRPNILFLFADDWGKYASVYAELDGAGTVNDAISTPHFDALSRDGVLFRNAFVNAPSCTPCRSSLLSGQYFWRTGRGAVLHEAIWDDSIPSWPLLLRDSGYHIGYEYKVWAPGAPRNAPYGGMERAYHAHGQDFNQFSQNVTRMITEDGKSVEAAKAVLINEVISNFRDFIADREGEQPFAFWFGPTNVHRKWTKGSGKDLWGIDPDALEGKMPAFLPDVHEVRQDLADYLGEAEAFDMAVGALIAELKRIGAYENTIIVISGDHGAPGFPNGKCNLYDFGAQVPLLILGPGVNGGRVVEDLVSLPDLAPTLLEAGNVDVPDVMTATSIWPTLRSEDSGWVDPARTEVFIGRERHVRNAREGHLPYPHRAIRTKDYLLIINFKPDRYPLGDPFNLENGNTPTADQLENNTYVTHPDIDCSPTKSWVVSHRNEAEWKDYYDTTLGKRPYYQLYDVQQDPYQVNNLAEHPEYQETLKSLEKRLLHEMKTTGDPRLENGGWYFEEIRRFEKRNAK